MVLLPSSTVDERSRLVTNRTGLLVTEFTQESHGTIGVMSCEPPKMVDEIYKLIIS